MGQSSWPSVCCPRPWAHLARVHVLSDIEALNRPEGVAARRCGLFERRTLAEGTEARYACVRLEFSGGDGFNASQYDSIHLHVVNTRPKSPNQHIHVVI